MLHDDISRRAATDFSRARLKGFMNRIRSSVSGRPNELLSYEQVRECLHLGGPIYRGVEIVPLDAIVGSLNRYQDFDRAFMPLKNGTANRWENVDLAHYQHKDLPPVVLYKVRDAYFVVDGHHRVSVARKQGLEDIDAEVRECSCRVKITPELKPEDLVILSEKVEFLERTHLDRLRPRSRVRLTLIGGFDRMLEHIAVHRYFMGIDLKREISEEEAVTHWYDTVYLPIVKIIRDSKVLREFPGRTEGDMYLWVLDRQQYLSQEEGRVLQPPEDAARRFIESGDYWDDDQAIR
ncbi:MAG TPA: ParB/RepB/Spo0J family partition protein [Anaerolineales bacterium]|nr:ParB/RepB/Spo0J family partition protein [Anaerolineales bacterium]